MKFTKGIWSLHDPAKSKREWGGNDHRILVLHPDGERILANLNTGFVGRNGAISTEERLANGRLIAAAPRMFEALKRAVSFLSEARGSGSTFVAESLNKVVNAALTGEEDCTESCDCGVCGQQMVRIGVSRWQCNYCDTVGFLEGRIKEAITLGIMISYTRDEAEKQELIRKLEALRLTDDEPTETI